MVSAIREARARVSLVGITAPGTEFLRPETKPKFRPVSPARDQISKTVRQTGRANAACSDKVSVIRDSGAAWWRTQSHANLSPRSNSLLTGKLTGNFANSGRSAAILASSRRANSMTCIEIPYVTEQGIFGGLTGNLDCTPGSEQGLGCWIYSLVGVLILELDRAPIAER